jgi:hypothetical protein
MKARLTSLISLTALCVAGSAVCQEPVTGVADPDSLFKSPDPQLNINKQAAYHIMKDLLEANHWELADKWLTAEYHQHNPMVASGWDGATLPPPAPVKAN